MTKSLRRRCQMKFAGYDHRCCAKVPRIGTKEAYFRVIVAGRYTLQRFADQFSVARVCIPLAGD
ncbi:hypothetical protein BK660_15325 [Pseudomonas brassicacearum]|uniref:Uncharacterized protein n=1 Tax=Pseudomonas brassicacearum TaxID=930166 RepID=A0A423I4U9_9PSED|nr:hypothetical protein BK660_15325 [Pseudomonas brassicacearum]